jgi:hypothetical protein
MSITSSSDIQAKILFVDMQGRTVSVINQMLKKGTNIFAVETNENWQPGVYNALLKINQETLTTRFCCFGIAVFHNCFIKDLPLLQGGFFI